MGGRAQERLEHGPVLGSDWSLRVVHEEPALAAIFAGCGLICLGTDGQADGHHAAVCVAFTRLLAARSHAGKSAACFCRETDGGLETGSRENSSSRSLRGERGGHSE